MSQQLQGVEFIISLEEGSVKTRKQYLEEVLGFFRKEGFTRDESCLKTFQVYTNKRKNLTLAVSIGEEDNLVVGNLSPISEQSTLNFDYVNDAGERLKEAGYKFKVVSKIERNY